MSDNLAALLLARDTGQLPDPRTAFFAAYCNAETLCAQGKLKDALEPYRRAAELAAELAPQDFGERIRVRRDK